MTHVLSLDGDISRDVLRRFQISESGEPTQARLFDIFEQWCLNIPYDTTPRMLHLLGSDSSSPLPALEPNDVLVGWLEHGTGATCFGLSLALEGLLRNCGYKTKLLGGKLWPFRSLESTLRDPYHCVCQVEIAGSMYILDPAFVHMEPLKLGEGWVYSGPEYAMAGVCKSEAGILLEAGKAMSLETATYILNQEITHEQARVFYEAAGRASDAFELFLRRVTPSYQISLCNRSVVIKSANKIERYELEEVPDVFFSSVYGMSVVGASNAAYVESQLREGSSKEDRYRGHVM